MIDFTKISALTFDCYGTLIDWESGILGALMPVLAAHGIHAPEADVLRLYAAAEADVEAGTYRRYREVLALVMDRVAGHFGVRLSESEREGLAESLLAWPAFADTPGALAALRERFTLCVCSNIDADLFEGSVPHLGLRPDWLVTADMCRSYKPNPRHFRVALALMDLPAERVLHVAQSRYHDIAPARAMGLRTAWINRASRAPNVGVAPAPPVGSEPDIELPDLVSLARMCGAL